MEFLCSEWVSLSASRTSNVITYLSRGDVALSVGMTSVNTLLAPFLTPAITYLILRATISVDVVAMFISCGFILGKILGLDTARTKAISIEVGMQNSGLATSLAGSTFPNLAMATVPGALFSVWHNISGALLASVYRRWNGSNDVVSE